MPASRFCFQLGAIGPARLTPVVRHHEHLPALSRFGKSASVAFHDPTRTIWLWEMRRPVAASAKAQYRRSTHYVCGWHFVRACINKPRHPQNDCLFSGIVRFPCWRHHVAVHAVAADSEVTPLPNHWLQAMPGFALLFGLALCPGMPEPKR